jgi:hypothetical protein
MDVPDLPPIGELVPLPRTWKEERGPNGGQWAEGSGGRDPGFMQDEVRRSILTYITAGAHYGVACKAAGIGRSTFKEWRRRAAAGDEPYATFWQEVEEAEAKAEVRLVAIWSQHAMQDYRAARDLLRVRAPERWNVNHVTEQVPDQPEIAEPIEDIQHLSEILAAYEEAGVSLVDELAEEA